MESTHTFENSFPDPLYYCIGVYHPEVVRKLTS